ncbi:MAG: sigma-70 family RNA polymerase sigma factor [Propionibacteriaceae bacterium]|jgi:RNA polymerase sigma-70 factor (ECF subfamily)|nr:sigma-70 family RNA polymerase sigma factor [Propionibacteriaceae bacterium]
MGTQIAVNTAVSALETALVMENHQKMVYAIAVTHTRNRVDAEDVFQEVFLTYHRKQPVCENEEHRKAWLIRTTLNIARRYTSSSWSTRVVPVETVECGQTYRFDNDEYDELFQALSALPENYRTVIYLFYFEDLSIAQISDVLEIEPGAIKMRLSRGRTMLREAMVKEDAHV